MIDPPRWREDPDLRPPNADAILRSARPRPPAAGELARLGASVARMTRVPPVVPRLRWRVALVTSGAVAAVAGGWIALRALGPRPAKEIAPPSGAPLFSGTPRARDDGDRAGEPEAEIAPSAPVAVAATPAPAAAGRPAQAPSPRVHARVHPSRAAASAREQGATDQLQREINLIDAARTELALAPGRALALLDDHQREFPNGQLAAEREFLAVEALRRTNQIDAARRRAQALWTHFPSSPYAARARRAFAPTPESDGDSSAPRTR